MSMGSEHQVCLLLGSNIQPEHNLPLAIDQLQNYLKLLRISRVWETASVGSAGPNFLNAAILAHTSLNQKSLKLKILRPLEARMGRVRSADKNAPRPIDLDIILLTGRYWTPLSGISPIGQCRLQIFSRNSVRIPGRR
jgi:2-amino-4-hydroxy-6-hydroxymethyldihydropteridine pyrophosphokinase